MSPRVPLPWRPSRRRIQRDVEDEIQGHIELKAQELERRGLAPDEARRRARDAFGSTHTVSAECAAIQRRLLRRRENHMWPVEVTGDLRWAVRSLARAPGFAVFAGLTLALGIAANTTILSVAKGLFFRSLPGVRDAETLVEISRGPGFVSVSYPMYEQFRDHAPALAGLAAFDVAGISLDARGAGAPEVVMGLQVSGDYFAVLGTRPIAGRFFQGAERDPASGLSVAVLSHRLWVERFDSDPSVVGSAVSLNGRPVTVIGVAEEGFAGHMAPAAAQLFMPLGSPLPGFHELTSLRQVDSGILELVGRVTPGTDLDALARQLGQLGSGLLQTESPDTRPYVAEVRRYAPVPGSFRGPAGTFFGIMGVLVGLVLAIACLNVAGLLISRAQHRRREIAVRMSLGAGRARLVRQLVTEALVLSGVAGVGGIVLTYWITGALSAFQLPVAPLPGLELDLHLRPDRAVMAYSTLLVLGTGILFGLAPALRATRADLVSDLKEGAARGGASHSRLQELLVGAQMAGSLVLLAGSGLFLRALVAAERLDMGFETADVSVASFDLELAGRRADESWPFYEALTRRARELPGVTDVAVAGKLPLAGLSHMAPVRFEGVEPPEGRQGFALANQSVGPGYFRTLGIPIVEGRGFLESDGATESRVLIVNQGLAEQMWPGVSPLGRAVTIPFGPDGPEAYAVVGVAATARYRRPDEEPRAFAYFAASQRPRTDMILHVKTRPGVAPPFPEIRRIASELEPAAATLSTGSLEKAVSLFILPQRAGAWVTGIVGIFGLLLGGLGVYGLTAYRVAAHRRELGVRIALGAGTPEVLLGVLRRGMIAPVVGGLIGVGTALVLSRFLHAFLFGIDPLDPVAFTAVVGTLVAVSVGANLVPAARAAALDPAEVLRAE